MKILVTGAAGFLGRLIAKKLLDEGNSVICFGGANSRFDDDIEQRAELTTSFDISDPNNFENFDAINEFDSVIHCAGIAHRFGGVSDDDYHKVNVTGTRNVAEFAAERKAKHFVHLSSVLVYGRQNNGGVITEETQTRPFDVYGQSKLDGESAVKEICEANGIDLTIFRPAPVIGEGSKGNFGRLIRAIDKRRFLKIGKGENKKSLIYAGDIAEACSHLLRHKKSGTEIFNLAGEPVATNFLLHEISDELGKNLPPMNFSPDLLRIGLKLIEMTPFRHKARSVGKSLDTWLSEDVYASDKIADIYNFKAMTSIKDAVRREVRHYLQNKQ